MPYGGSGSSSGGGYDLVGAAKAEKKAAKAAKKRQEAKQGGRDGLFGTGVGPDYSLEDVFNEPAALGKDLVGFVVGGGKALGETANALAWGVRHKYGIGAEKSSAAANAAFDEAGDISSAFGKGMTSSLAGTASTAADVVTMQPVRSAVGHMVGLEELGYGPGRPIREATGGLLGEAYKPQSFGERVEDRHSFLSPLVEDVGNAAMVAGIGAGAVKGARAVGAISPEAATTALAKIEPFKHPLREGWERTGRSVTRAGRKVALGQNVLPDSVTESYYTKHGADFGLDKPYAVDETRTLDERTGRALAKAFKKAPTTLDNLDPEVADTYAQFAREVDAQYEHIFGDGKVRVEYGPRDANPYPARPDGSPDPQAIFEDIQNGHLWVDETGAGEEHPFLTKEQNDRFRAVHDYMGHSRSSNDFGMAGEEVAYQHHAQMFSPKARRALAMETRGFQGDLHWSKRNRKRAAKGKPKEFGDQRVGLMPEDLADPAVTIPDTMGTPAEQAAVRAMNRRIPTPVAKAVSRLNPEGATIRALDWLEGKSQMNDAKMVYRQMARHMEAARNKMRADPAVKALVATARDLIERKGLNEYEANAIVAGELEWRLSAKGAIWDDAVKANPELLEYLEKAHHRTPVPEGVIDDQIAQALDEAAEMWRVKADERYQALISDTRLGGKGLEAAGTDTATLTQREAKLLAKAKKDMERATKARAKAVKEAQAWAAEAGRLRDRSSALVKSIHDDIEAGRARTVDFDQTRTSLPKGFRNLERFRARMAQAVADTLENEGATYSPHEDRFLTPAAYGGTDTGWAVSLAPETRVTIPVDQWVALGPQALDALALEYQTLFDDPHHLIGTWFEKDKGLVHVDISQTHYEGAPITRDQAIILGHARSQVSVFDLGSGETLYMERTPGRPEVAAVYADANKHLVHRGKVLRDAVEAKRTRWTQEDVDGLMAAQMEMGYNLWRNGRIKSPDDFFNAERFQVRRRISPNMRSKGMLQTVLGLDFSKPETLDLVLREMDDVEKAMDWYYGSHDAIERMFRLDPKTGLERRVLLPSGVYDSMAELVYDLVALTSVVNDPTSNLGQAMGTLAGLLEQKKALPAARKLVRSLEKGGLTPEQTQALALEYARTVAEGKPDTHALEVVQRTVMDRLTATHTDDTGNLVPRGLETWDAEFLDGQSARLGPRKPDKAGKVPQQSMLPQVARGLDLEDFRRTYGSKALAKLKSFRNNLANPHESLFATMDSWMARGQGDVDTVYGGVDAYAAGEDAIRAATQTMNDWFPGRDIKPHSLQALFWVYTKKRIGAIEAGRHLAAWDLTVDAIRNGTWTPEIDPTPSLWRTHIDTLDAEGGNTKVVEPTRIAKRQGFERPEATLLEPGAEYETIDREFIATGGKKGDAVRDKAAKYAPVQAEVARLVAAGDLLGAEAVYQQWAKGIWNNNAKRQWFDAGGDLSDVIRKGPSSPRAGRGIERSARRLEDAGEPVGEMQGGRLDIGLDRTVEPSLEGLNADIQARNEGLLGSGDEGDVLYQKPLKQVDGERQPTKAGLKARDRRARRSEKGDYQHNWAPRGAAGPGGPGEYPIRWRAPEGPWEAPNDAVRARYGITDLESAQALLDAPEGLDVGLLAQQFEEAINGAFVPLPKEGRYLLEFYETADVSTLFHETGHMLRHLLPENELRAVESAYEITDGVWDTAAHERFADDVVRYFNTGLAPAHLRTVYARMREVLRRIYDALVNRSMSKAVDPRVQGVLDRWFDPEVVTPDEGLVPGTKGQVSLTADGTPFRTGDFEAGSLRQRLGRSPRLQDRTAQQGYREGVTATNAVRDVQDISRRIAEKQAAKGRADKAVAKIEDLLANPDRLPGNQEAARLEAAATASYDKVAASLDSVPVSRVPGEWAHLWGSVQDLHKFAKDDPHLAGMLEDVADTFPEVVRIAREKGFDPKHIRDFSSKEVEALVYDAVTLGKHGRLGKQTEAGTRRSTNLARLRAGDAERSIEAFAAAHLEVTHERLSNALVDFIEQHLVVPVKAGDRLPAKGTVAWDATRAALLGEEINVGTNQRTAIVKPGTKYVIPEAVDRALRRMSQDYSHGLFGAIGKVTNPWRNLVLTLSPRWYVNNFIGNLALATLEGVRLRDWKAAWDSYKNEYADLEGAVSRHSQVSDIGEPSYIDKPLVKGFKESARAGETIPAKVGKVRRHSGTKVRRLNEVVDEIARAAVYKKTLRTTGDVEAALHRSYDALVDYGNLSPFERQAVRSVVPFYSWQKGVLKIAARLPVDHPILAGLIVQFGEANREAMEKQWGGEVPMSYLGLIDSPIGDGQISTRGWNPLADSLSLTTPDGIASSLNPFLSVFARQALGAPEMGWSDDVRMDPYGFSIPNPGIGPGLTDVAAGVPLARAAESAVGSSRYGQGNDAVKLLGVNYQTPKAVKAAMERARKTGVRQGVRRSTASKTTSGPPTIVGASGAR